MKKEWKIQVWKDGGDSEVYFLDCEKYPLHVVYEIVEAAMEALSGVDYSIKEVEHEN